MTAEVRFHRAATVLLTAALLATLTVALTGGNRADAVEGPVEVVYVATGQNFPDALAGANLAATVGAPMLTVNPGLPLPDATITALEALDPNQIIILGGPVAVSEPVADALADYTRAGAVSRIEGGDRHDTAAKIADALPSKVHDADELDGLDSTAFARTDHDHDGTYLGAGETAADSGSLAGRAAADLRAMPLPNWVYLDGGATLGTSGALLPDSGVPRVGTTFMVPPGHVPGTDIAVDILLADGTTADCGMRLRASGIARTLGDGGSTHTIYWLIPGADDAPFTLSGPAERSNHLVTLVLEADAVAAGWDAPGSVLSFILFRFAGDAADTCGTATTVAGAQVRY